MLDEKAKKTLLQYIPHPINVCGVKEGNEINGFTLSWTTQASFKPPMIVIGVRQDSRSCSMIKTSQVFAISFLEKSQQKIAETFFQPQRRVENRFGEYEFYLSDITGCPVLKEALGYVECTVKGSLEEGDHWIFLGEVVGAQLHREGDPLWLKDTKWQYGG
jgi:flavin reductase (DIM6/NTAB) family NADH-FMN oxidoreductase RutF